MGVRMTHPDLPDGQDYDATPGQVPHLVESGWRVAPGQDEQGEVWPAEAQRFEGQEQVRIRHPGTGGEAVVARSAVPFHVERGWQEVTDQAEPEAAPPDDLDDLTVPDLQDLLRARGLPVSGSKAELVERLRAAPAEAPAEPAGPSEEE